MTIETLISNGDGDDAIRIGIAELEFHANMGGSHPESIRRDPPRRLSRYAGGLSIRSEFPRTTDRWRRL